MIYNPFNMVWFASGLCFFALFWVLVAVRGLSLVQRAGAALVEVHGLLHVAASLVTQLGSRMQAHCGAWLSCPTARGVFPDQGSNLCSLHWQVGSEPPDHQGSLLVDFGGIFTTKVMRNIGLQFSFLIVSSGLGIRVPLASQKEL